MDYESAWLHFNERVRNKVEGEYGAFTNADWNAAYEMNRAHADKIEECERYRKALIHQRTALQIVRDRQRGNVGIDDLNKGIALIDAALKETK